MKCAVDTSVSPVTRITTKDTWTTGSKTRGRRRPFLVFSDVVREPLLFWSATPQHSETWTPGLARNQLGQEIAAHHLLLDLMSKTGTFLGSWTFKTKILQPNSVKSHDRNGSTAVHWPCSQTESARDSSSAVKVPCSAPHVSMKRNGGFATPDTHRFLNNRLGHLSADVGSRLVHLNGNPGSRRRHTCARPNHHTCWWFCILSNWRLDAQDSVSLVLDQNWLTVLGVTTRVRNHVLGTRVLRVSQRVQNGVEISRFDGSVFSLNVPG